MAYIISNAAFDAIGYACPDFFQRFRAKQVSVCDFCNVKESCPYVGPDRDYCPLMRGKNDRTVQQR